MDSFLAKAIQALPDIATSPLALFAYLATIGAYIFVALRVKRHKNLLQHLAVLPERDRIKALEAELGDAKLKTGVTAEEWIRSRIHRYFYLAFLATCITVIVIVSLVLYRTSGSVEVDVTGYRGASILENTIDRVSRLLIPSANAAEFDFLDTTTSNRTDVDSPEVVKYQYEKKDGKLFVSPRSALLDAIDHNQQIEGFGFWHQPFEWDFPILSVKIVNNTDKTLLLSEARIDVLGSTIDMRPILVINSPSYQSRFNFRNEGWGPVLSPSLTVTMNDTSCSQSASTIKRAIPVSQFLEGHVIDLSKYVEPQLKRELVKCSDDVEMVCMSGMCIYGPWDNLKCTEPFNGSEICKSVAPPLSAKDLKHFDIAKKSRGALTYMRQCRRAPMCVKGILSYLDEDNHKHAYRFKTLVHLGEPGVGAPAPPSYSYDVFLKAGKSGYVVTRDLSQEIKPGQTDHFLLRIATDKSSNFQIKLTIKDTKGDSKWSGNIDMTTFVPRSGASLALRNLKH